jgi:putative endonuclease
MKKHRYYIYILASKKYGALYIGVTNDLSRRLFEHKEGLIEGYTKEHDIKQLVYVEVFDYVDQAIKREKDLKKWKREWKIELIMKSNPEWKDLYEELHNWI